MKVGLILSRQWYRVYKCTYLYSVHSLQRSLVSEVVVEVYKTVVCDRLRLLTGAIELDEQHAFRLHTKKG